MGQEVQRPYGSVPLKGRGAVGNPTGRFEAIAISEFTDSDWAEGFSDSEFQPLPQTRFWTDHSKRIITTNDSPDIAFEASVNPYRGCEHGCSYCYARPYHEYLGFSAGLDFERNIIVKPEAPRLLRAALSAKSWVPKPIAISGVTDCYQPAERRFKLTRGCLEVLADFRNPVAMITKNALITRDIDVLQDLARYQAVCVMVSVTTLDEALVEKLEPRTSRPHRRLAAIRALSDAGIPVGVMMGPIIPGLTDHEMAPVLQAAADAGAITANYTLLRLAHGLGDLFAQWLEAHAPMRKERVLNHVRGMHGGRLNNNTFGRRMRGAGHYADYIRQWFALTRKRVGLDASMPVLSTAHFRDPAGGQQLSLF
ncbi:MAG: PA0069 family radical SAM protein [Cyanobacteria bacterium HKST-UBA03]|nr:PA0069 family radical SAM protein [Cyanobacteria bacterium HKST-UBA03]